MRVDSRSREYRATALKTLYGAIYPHGYRVTKVEERRS